VLLTTEMVLDERIEMFEKQAQTATTDAENFEAMAVTCRQRAYELNRLLDGLRGLRSEEVARAERRRDGLFSDEIAHRDAVAV
jgi:hypothetical protein